MQLCAAATWAGRAEGRGEGGAGLRESSLTAGPELLGVAAEDGKDKAALQHEVA